MITLFRESLIFLKNSGSKKTVSNQMHRWTFAIILSLRLSVGKKGKKTLEG